MKHHILYLFHLSAVLALAKGQNSTNYTWLETPLNSSSNATINITTLLFPYGLSNGDKELPRSDDDTHIVFTSETGFPFLTNRNYELRASINGYVFVSGGPQIDIYRMDLDTRSKGSIYYRHSKSPIDLALIYQTLCWYGVSSFNSRMNFIITYYNVPKYRYTSQDNTFQFIYATDFKNSYGIFNYQKLESTTGSAKFNEGTCNQKDLPSSGSSYSNRLASSSNGPVLGRYVYKLSKEKCRIYEDSGIIFTNASMYYVNVPTRIMSSNDFSWSHRRAINFSMLMEQRLNNENNFAVSFVTSGINNSSSKTTNYKLWAAVDKTYGSNEFFQIMGIPNYFNEKYIEYGSFSIPAFYQASYCLHYNFKTNFTYSPSIKIGYTNIVFPYKYVLIWLMNVTKFGFQVCLKEIAPFSGLKRITVKYIAVANDSTEFPEVGKIHLTEVSHMRHENNRFCHTLIFKLSYTPKPHVFVTADVGERGPGVRSWVKEIHNRRAVICASATSDTLQERHTNITLHYLINGRKDPCSNIICPRGQECVLNADFETSCTCMSFCIDTYEPVCGHSFVTYNNTCWFFRAMCLQSKTSPDTYLHQGECKTFPYQAGSVLLEPIPNIPVAFCKHVHLNSKRFVPDFPMYIQLTVTWRNQTFKEGSAAWSENVTTYGFRACALVAGRHFSGSVPTPTVFWMAYQRGLIIPSNGQLTGGSIVMSAWYSGSRCLRLPGVHGYSFVGSAIFLSVEHTKRRTYTNAMTIWVEYWRNDWYACIRELQNFDGKHEGIKLHWLMMRRYKNSWNNEIISEVIQRVMDTNKDAGPICSESQVNKIYLSLPNPTLIATPVINRFSSEPSSNNSENDVAAWLQRTDRGKVGTCIQSGISHQRVKLNVMVVPSLCKDGWSFHDSRCFFLGKTRNKSQAEQICQHMNATLTVIRSKEQLYFMKTLEITSNTWIGLTDSAQEGIWRWNNDKTLMVKNWGLKQPDGGATEKCVVMNISDEYKWHDRPCSEINDYVCEKDVDLLKHWCEGHCLNDGKCIIKRNNTKCLCPPGFWGDKCENNVKNVPECNNYTSLFHTWRRVNQNISKPSSICDRKLTSNSTWYRFEKAKILEHGCSNTTSHSCGVKYPGYLNQTHPSVEDGVKKMLIHYYRYHCSGDYGTVFVRNCTGFYVYKFPYLPDCEYGICTEYMRNNTEKE